MRGNRTKAFRQSLIIRQVGARPLRTKRGTLFKLGGGVFSKRQILAGRKRWGRLKVKTRF